MSSLLRSTKFVRYFCGAARTLILNSAKNVETSLLIDSKRLYATSNVIVRDYASAKRNESLEPLLHNMDVEIRKTGRISKRILDELFEEIKLKKDLSSSQSLLVIRCCGDILSEELPEKRTQLVQKVWSMLADIGVPMDISHYNILLRVYIENEHPFSPAEFLEELQNKGIQPNHVTYQRLMWRYCQEGDIDGATKLLENMRELGLPITIPVLNALVMGHANLGDTEGAQGVLNTVTGAGLHATNHTYSLLACGFAKKGDLDGVQNVLKEAKNNDILMSNKYIFSIIEALALNGHADKVDPLFEHIQEGISYRQDGCNAILNLINKGQEEVAKKILKTFTIPKGWEIDDWFYQGNFFVKQILKAYQSPEQIVQSCQNLQAEGLVPNALLIALEGSLQQGNVELAQRLLQELRSLGVEIRQHYYWPLFVQKGKENDEEAVLHLLKNMYNDGLRPSKETIQNYVLPYLHKNADPENNIIKLQIVNVPTIVAARCVIIELLQGHKIDDAAVIAQKYNLRGIAYIKDVLIGAFYKTHNINAFVTILGVAGRKEQADDTNLEEDPQTVDNRKDIDYIVQSAVRGLKTPSRNETFLSSLLSKGVGISVNAAKGIEEYLGENMTPKISDTLSKLASPNIEVPPAQRTMLPKLRNSDQLEALINISKSKERVHLLQKQLLNAYIKENKLEKLNSFLKDIEAQNVELSSTALANLLEYYCENNDLEKALHYKQLLTEKYPTYKLYNLKIVLLALCLTKAKRTDEAIELFKSNASDNTTFYNYSTKCWQLLNELAEQKDVEKLKEIFNVMLQNKFIEPSNILLGPLVKVHILCDDIDGALKQFEQCCKEYRSTPWKGELMKQLILAEDASKLQWVADLSTQIHGEVNVLYDLILAFVECGKLRQARRILETPGLYLKNDRLDAACKRYATGGRSECIEGLLEATRELSNVDRSKIFYHLLTSYCQADETDKALGLWNLLQEEGEVPSDEFLSYLGQHLKAKNREVPFVVSETKQKEKHNTNEANVVDKKTSNNNQYSNEIEALIKEGKHDEATNLTLKLLKDGTHPNRNIISFLLKSLAENGDVEKILLLKPYYENERKPVNYQHKLMLATVMSGSGSKIINELQQLLSVKDPENDYLVLVRKFPKAEALNILLKDEELAVKCESVAESFISNGNPLPVNLLWMECIICGQKDRADRLWNKYLINENFIKFRRLLQYSCNNQSPDYIVTLIEYLKTNKKINADALGNAYSRLISLYLTNNAVEKAKECVDQALSSGLVQENINLTSWKNLKKACLANGLSFTYNVTGLKK